MKRQPAKFDLQIIGAIADNLMHTQAPCSPPLMVHEGEGRGGPSHCAALIIVPTVQYLRTGCKGKSRRLVKEQSWRTSRF